MLKEKKLNVCPSFQTYDVSPEILIPPYACVTWIRHAVGSFRTW